MRRFFLFGLVLILGAAFITPFICERGARTAYEGSLVTHRKMALGMNRFIDGDLSADAFSTGSKTFDGEWLFGTYFMAGLGYLQTARQHEALREEHVALAEKCVEAILSERVKVFDTGKWSEDAIETLEDGDGHAAYLGYLGLLLGVLRDVHPDTRFAGLHDAIADALAKRIARSPIALVETYPGERYPVDNLAVYAALALADEDVPLDDFVARFIDASGLLIQAVLDDGTPVDKPRGSGTALGAYFASFFSPALSSKLYAALDRELARSTFGFGTVREYPAGVSGGGDIDSGPIVLGAGLSATGFSLATARRHGDEARFRAVWRTANLWGAPLDDGERFEWVNGGPLGNAIMFAMTTAEVAR